MCNSLQNIFTQIIFEDLLRTAQSKHITSRLGDQRFNFKGGGNGVSNCERPASATVVDVKYAFGYANWGDVSDKM